MTSAVFGAKLWLMEALTPVMPYAWAAAALPFLVLWLLARRRVVAAERRAESLAAELRDIKERPDRWEARIERHDLLWFPVLTADPGRREVTEVAPGVPHCKSCVRPMAIEKTEWVCGQCGQRRPETVADLVIIDGVGRDAVKQYLERHPEWRAGARVSGSRGS